MVHCHLTSILVYEDHIMNTVPTVDPSPGHPRVVPCPTGIAFPPIQKQWFDMVQGVEILIRALRQGVLITQLHSHLLPWM
jgi:hypothetical protein